MKTVKFLFLAIAATVTLAACNNNNNDDDTDTPSGYYLNAKVDGNTYESNTSLLTGSLVADQIILGGFESFGGKSFTLVFLASLPAGTYTYTGEVDNDVTAVYYPGGIASASYGDISGSVTILEHDTAGKTIKGEFEFIAFESISEDSVTVTDGKFNMKYQ